MEKVTLTKNCFSKRSIFTVATAEIEVPELNSMMGIQEDQIAVIKVQQLDLNAYTTTRSEIQNYSRNLIEGITEASQSKSEVKDESLEVLRSMSPDTKYKISIIEKGLLEPKLNQSDIIFLSKMFPYVTMRIYNKIMELTTGGGVLGSSVKKN